jgi:hypothetical protein
MDTIPLNYGFHKRRWDMGIRFIQFGALLLLLAFGAAHATVFYVDLNSPNPPPPCTSWNTAANDIQSAVDASSDGDLIWVTNGVYQTGGRVVYGLLTQRLGIIQLIP